MDLAEVRSESFLPTHFKPPSLLQGLYLDGQLQYPRPLPEGSLLLSTLLLNSPVNTPQTIVNTFEKFTNLLVRATSFEPVGQPLIVPVVDLRNTCILTKSLKNECEIVINCDYAYSHE